MLDLVILDLHFTAYNPTQDLADSVESTLLLTTLKTFIASYFLSSFNPIIALIPTSLLLTSAVCINENGFTAPVITHQKIQNIRIIVKTLLALLVGILFCRSRIPFLPTILMFSACIYPFVSLWTLSKAIEFVDFFMKTIGQVPKEINA